MSRKRWTAEDIEDQTDRVAIVTGANSGIGLETARALAHKGATVVLACRNAERGEAALANIREGSPKGSVELQILDLANLESVRAFADGFKQKHQRLDLLVNNAGIMMPPASTTKDGFELQFGVNHLGHFALTGLLTEWLGKTDGSRVVTVSSMAHKFGAIAFDDLQWQERKYKKMASYGQSKLANLLFTYELQRRFEAAGLPTTALAAHPGWTQTELQRNAASFRMLNPLFAMKPWKGALPTLRAATDAEARGGEYYGPKGMMEMNGFPTRVSSSKQANDAVAAKRLWEVSEELTGVSFQL